MQDVVDYRVLLGDEIFQCREEGRDVARYEGAVRDTLARGSQDDCILLIDQLATAPLRQDWRYVEPTTLDAIRATLPPVAPLSLPTLDPVTLRDHILGAWLGRCAGCNLGKPFEGWRRADIRTYLQHADAYPLVDYVPLSDPMPAGFSKWTPEFVFVNLDSFTRVLNVSWPETTRGNVKGMARDDDTDYTILGLHILESFGYDFSTDQIAETWLHRFPILEIYTAEREVYRSLVAGKTVAEAATWRNPYREWIGGQIRADMWGYVNAGLPAAAAAMAYRDATLTHVKNGVYGAMWAAALIAACFGAPDARTALQGSRAQIPPRSRLAEALDDVVALYDQGIDWETARDGIEERYYAKYSFVHTIPNAALVAMSLLWGAGDFTKTIAFAVQGGWDTDCNGATAGSAFGALHGAGNLPAQWVMPLRDVIRSSLTGFDGSRISDLAERTWRLTLANPARR